MFGGLQAEHGRYCVEHFATKKAGVLLGFLALHPNKRFPREELAALLWPDAYSDRGRHNLRTALAILRKQLQVPGVEGSPLLLAEREAVWLNSAAFVTDVREFELLLAEAHATKEEGRTELLARAISLYQGDLLPGYYEDFILLERQRLADGFQKALHELIRLLEKQEAFGQATEFAYRALAFDPLDESAQATLLQLLVAQGQKERALQRYQEIERLFQAQLQSPPPPSLQQLAAQIKKQLALSSAYPSPVAKPLSMAAPSAPLHVNLPTYMTGFFGRQWEREQLLSWLGSGQNVRLVSITGPGGVGKTRLAVEVAHELVRGYAQQVAFVPLAELTQVTQAAEAVLTALQAARVPRLTPEEQLPRVLHGRSLLLILDNFEQLEEEGVLFLRRLLDQVPHLRLLVTSRRRLNLEGEHEIPLKPLPFPEKPTSYEELKGFAAIQTFLERAQRRNPEFALNERNAETVRLLCLQLDGLPLALELAAAWITMMSPAQMLTRLEKGFDLLVSRHHDMVSRHRTLKGAIAWSYQMLPNNLQNLLRKLSVFRGGWSAEAAEWVCGENTLQDLALLLEHSLVTAYPIAPNVQRWRMLGTIREFAAEQLDPEEKEQLRYRHALYFHEFLHRAYNAPSDENLQWIRFVEMEQENVRAAIDWCLLGKEPELGVSLGQLADEFWRILGYRDDRGRWRTLSFPRLNELPPAQQALVLYQTAITGREDAITLLERAIAIYQEQGDRAGVAGTHDLLAQIYGEKGLFEQAESLFQQALQEWTDLGDSRNYGITLANFTGYTTFLGRYSDALPQLETCLRINKEHTHCMATEAVLRRALGEIKRQQGELAEAYPHLLHAHKIFSMRAERSQLVRTLYALGLLEAMRGDYNSASTCLEEQRRIEAEIALRAHHIPSVRLRLELLWQTAQWETLKEACLLSEEVLRAFDSPIADEEVAGLRFMQAQMAAHEGRDEVALELLQEVSSMLTYTIAWDEVARALSYRALLLWRKGHPLWATDILLQAIDRCEQSGLLPEQERLLRLMGQQLVHQERYTEARALLAASETMRLSGGWIIPPVERKGWEEAIQQLKHVFNVQNPLSFSTRQPHWQEVWRQLPTLLRSVM